ncbi:MAG: ribosome recycling factor, partial [Candidatus Cloacimonetes bacterium]|nr:ribosome recycling factor [Candidatus Cloacimonadota bacterium]
ANTAALDEISIDYYGAATPVKQLCNITIPEPRLIVIQPWDKTALDLIEKAILASNIGVTPQNDGNVIRLPFQPLTEEIRRDIVKEVKKMSEDGKIEIRNIRRAANDSAKKMQKDSEISEDEQKILMDDIQELTNSWIVKITEATKTKETEIMEV